MSLSIYVKIQQVRVKLQELNLKKGGKNAFANFTYYQLDDFIPALNKLMLDVGLFSAFNIKDGIATLTIINSENNEQQVVFESPIASADIKGSTPIQCLGGIHTYMKRYLYQNAFEIVEPDLFDALVKSGKLELNVPKDKENVPNEKPLTKSSKQIAEEYGTEQITLEQLQFIQALGDKVSAWACQKYQVNSLEQLSIDNANEIINMYNKKKEGKK